MSQSGKTHFARVVRAIARVTFLEIIRDKILYNTVLIALAILITGFLAGRISWLMSERIVTDFGVSAINLSGAMIGILIGAGALPREIERRTIFVALSHPISKAQFIFGKFFGISVIQVVNWLILTSLIVLILIPFSDLDWFVKSPALWIGFYYLLIQSFLMTSVAIFFSTITTTSLAVSCSVGLYLIGNNLNEIQSLILRQGTPGPLLTLLVKVVTNLLPNLQHFNLGTQITYGLPIPFVHLVFTTLYGLVFSGVLLLLSGLFFQSKEV